MQNAKIKTCYNNTLLIELRKKYYKMGIIFSLK
jgi:hypothetical protein